MVRSLAVRTSTTTHPEVAGDTDLFLDGLTPREQGIVRGIVEGLSNKQIAERCGISDRTVRNRLTAIFEKFEVRSRTQLLRRVMMRARR